MKLLILLLLVSCGVNVKPKDMLKAEEVCKDSGGLNHIEPTVTLSAICNYTKEGERRLKSL